ncbi:MAG: protein-glutamate O-methyltransferase [Candidatus Obscuribacterales bacterium]|nr:protein-glutamate O-methyltransferase [Steroidobacteraceae bacterium]
MSNATKPASATQYPKELGDAEFDFLRHVVMENAGIALGPNKRLLVQGRLARRLRALDLASYAEYCEYLRNGGPEELVNLINAITTNVTAFFRENHHFEQLARRMLPEAMERNASSRRIRIWSAGCSSGEEPYSIAMTVLDKTPLAPRWDVKILATDIDSDMVSTAAAGEYPEDRLIGVPEALQRRWFRRGGGDNAGMVKVKSELSELLTFRPLNLLHEWPLQGPFDVIFCRNVMIYFDQPTRDRLLARFARLLAHNGFLCIGHSESIPGDTGPFKLVGRTIYCKTRPQVQDAD